MIANSLGDAIRDLLEQDDVIELMLNPDGVLWVQRLSGTGKEDSKIRVEPARATMLIELVAGSINAVCNSQVPTLAAELPGSGYRFQGVLPPIVKPGPTINIRKKSLKVFTLDDYVDSEIMSQIQREHIKTAVFSKENILIVGSTGSGKTTLANAVLDVMGTLNDRIIIIEDTGELQCNAEDYVQMRADNSKDKIETHGTEAILHVSLRMSPKRIVVGEVRDGGSALTLIEAWNTGHPGGLCTVHADSAEDGLRRLEMLISRITKNGNPESRSIARAVDLVIFITRIAVDPYFKVQELLTVSTYNSEKDEYILKKLE